MSIADRPNTFYAECARHDRHYWEWYTEPEGLLLLRPWAVQHMLTLCPEQGNILVWWSCIPNEPHNPINWILRKDRSRVEDDEVAVALATFTNPPANV